MSHLSTKKALQIGFGSVFISLGVIMIGLGLIYLEALPTGWYIIGGGLMFLGCIVTFTEFTKGSIALVIAVLVAGCGVANAGKPSWFQNAENTSNKIADAAFKAVPYPLADVIAGGFLERQNQAEKLKRFSKPNKEGFVYVMSFGKFVGYYAIKGKVSAVNSSLTNPTQTWKDDCGHECGYGNAVESIGDDGTFGTNEGGDRGVFFLTTNGAMVVTVLDWMYADKPITVGNIPQLYG